MPRLLVTSLLYSILAAFAAGCADPVELDAGMDAAVVRDAQPMDAIADAEPIDADPIDAEPVDAEPDAGPRPDLGFAIRSGSLTPSAGVAESPSFRVRGGLGSTSPSTAQSPEHKLRGGLVPASH